MRACVCILEEGGARVLESKLRIQDIFLRLWLTIVVKTRSYSNVVDHMKHKDAVPWFMVRCAGLDFAI